MQINTVDTDFFVAMIGSSSLIGGTFRVTSSSEFNPQGFILFFFLFDMLITLTSLVILNYSTSDSAWFG